MTEQPFEALGVNDGDVQAQLQQLRHSNEQLSADVRALTDTILLVHTLAQEQAELKTKTEQADVRIREVDIATQERINRTRKAGFVAAAVGVVAIPLVSILVYLSLINHVNHLLDIQKRQSIALREQQNRNSYQSCTTRNAATNENADREEELAKIETNPKVIRIHAESAAKLRSSTINCSMFLKPVVK